MPDLLTDRALGIGGSHFVSKDLPPNIEAAVMHHDITAAVLPANSNV
jgi:hypothetical protein